MAIEEREIVQEVVRQHLMRARPEVLARIGPTLASLLDIAYDTVTQAANEDPKSDPVESGPPIDTSLGEATIIATATWIATTLFRHVRQALRDHRRPQLGALELSLAEASGLSKAEIRQLLLEVIARLQRLEASPLPAFPTPRVWPDHVLLVDFDRISQRLRFQLRSRSGGPPQIEFSEPLRRDPYSYVQALYQQIDTAGGEVRERLADIGAQLARDLLPPELRSTLAAAAGGSPTLEIVFDDSWIPWDLLYLDHGQGGGAFLGESFALARWRLDLDHRLRLPLRRLALVVPPRGDLGQAEPEAGDFNRWQGTLEVERLEPRRRRLRRVLADEAYDGWHFIGHYHCRDIETEQWGLPLDDYQILAEFDLQHARRTLETTRPLIFLNACGTAKGGLSLTGPGGLAERFLELGAGAVVAARWQVTDHEARAFASAFYDAFLTGIPLAESTRQARLEVEKLHPASPGWLAYTVCGHPLAERATDAAPVEVPREQS